MLICNCFKSIIQSFKNIFATVNQEESNDMVIDHSTHVEDLIFTRKQQGVQEALASLKQIKSQFGSSHIDVSTKIDGCLDGDTLVVTTNGPKKFSSLTNSDFVKCYDAKNDKYIWCSNTFPRNTGRSKQWVEISLKGIGKIRATTDHPFMTIKGDYVEAKQLKFSALKSSNDKGVFVDDVVAIQGKRDQWDMTTSTSNFIIVVNGVELIAHNSPAIFLVNGDNGFGVATKSIFNKTPKVNYTVSDIRKNHKKDVAGILEQCLTLLPKIASNEKNTIYQADTLFLEGEVKNEVINRIQNVTFQPNTLLYAINKRSDLGKRIANAKLGIVIHTKYTWDGKDPTTMDAIKLGCSKDQLNQDPDVFVLDTNEINDRTTTVIINNVEKERTQAYEDNINMLSDKIDWNILDDFKCEMLIKFMNSYVRSGINIPAPGKLIQDLQKYVKQQHAKDIKSRTTYKGKKAIEDKYAVFKDFDYTLLRPIFEIYLILIKYKMILVNKLNMTSSIKKYVVSKSGQLTKTFDEGYIITEGVAKGIKLVNRYQFSKYNFSEDYIHGHQHREALKF